jgi:hypothetical protein
MQFSFRNGFITSSKPEGGKALAVKPDRSNAAIVRTGTVVIRVLLILGTLREVSAKDQSFLILALAAP